MLKRVILETRRYLFLVLLSTAVVSSGMNAMAFSHGEAQHSDHPFAVYCDHCDCCNYHFTCDMAHKWVCFLNSSGCELHDGKCTNQTEPT
jgi:hypothetical protein